MVGYPLLFPEMDQTTMLFLATGAPAITLITMGLVALPQVVSQARLEGSLEYMRSLPVPRLAYLAADLTVWMVIVLPGVVFAVLVGVWALGLDLDVSWLIIPAALLVAVTSAAVGYAMASLLPPMIAMLVTQVLVFAVLIFSPINFPASRLPDWLQDHPRHPARAGHGRGHPGLPGQQHLPAHERPLRAAGCLVRRLAGPELPRPHAARLMTCRRDRARPPGSARQEGSGPETMTRPNGRARMADQTPARTYTSALAMASAAAASAARSSMIEEVRASL